MVSTVVIADDKPISSLNKYEPAYISLPNEIPKSLTFRLDFQITIFHIELLDSSWELDDTKQDD